MAVDLGGRGPGRPPRSVADLEGTGRRPRCGPAGSPLSVPERRRFGRCRAPWPSGPWSGDPAPSGRPRSPDGRAVPTPEADPGRVGPRALGRAVHRLRVAPEPGEDRRVH